MHKSGASNLSSANIMEAFMRKHSLATCSSIVAAYTTRAQGSEVRSVTYMDEASLREFLFESNSKTDGILQLFVDQSCHLNTDAASERPWDYGVDSMPRRK
jgi:hypothetical protein